jgi:hypothetical protein
MASANSKIVSGLVPSGMDIRIAVLATEISLTQLDGFRYWRNTTIEDVH